MSARRKKIPGEELEPAKGKALAEPKAAEEILGSEKEAVKEQVASVQTKPTQKQIPGKLRKFK